MKAAVHTDAFRLEIVDREVPKVTDYDHVLIKVGAVGFCGSDKHDLDHAPNTQQTPGHEFAGVVADIGSDPAEFAIGDRVVIRPATRCGKCDECLKRPRGKCTNPGVHGCRGIQHPPGAMAEYVLVRTENLTKIPDDVSLEEAAMTDPLGVAIYAVDLGPAVQGSPCVIMGAGAIGLLLAQVLQYRGAGPVVLVDVLQSHLEIATRLGDFVTMLGEDRERLAQELQAVESGVYYELAGGESPTLDIAIECIERSGWILLVSQRPKGAWINYQWVMGKGLTLRGVSGCSKGAWDESMQMIFSHKVQTKPLITHTYPLEDAQEALMTACKGDSVKVMVKPNADPW